RGIQRGIGSHEGRSGVWRSFGVRAWEEVRRVGRMNRARGTARAMRFHELLMPAINCKLLCAAVALRFVERGLAFLYLARDVRALLELLLLRGCHDLDRRAAPRKKRRRNENVTVPRHALPGQRSFGVPVSLVCDTDSISEFNRSLEYVQNGVKFGLDGWLRLFCETPSHALQGKMARGQRQRQI
ncbi:hypothetical protein DFH09DRAFT_1157553, partial [Mycena vulgaris]